MSSIPSLAPRFYSATASRETERECSLWLFVLLTSPDRSAHKLKDFCPTKTNGDSLKPRLLMWLYIARDQSNSPESWPTVRHWRPDKARRKGGCLLLNKKRGLPKQPSCGDTLCSFPLLGPISHGKYFHNRASSSSLPALDLRLQYKQFWVKAEGRARCGK